MRSVLGVLVLSLCACVTPSDDRGGLLGTTQVNKLEANKLSVTATRDGMSQVVGSELTADRLTTGTMMASDAVLALASTADGAEVLSYAISCALDSDQIVMAGSAAFAGQVGLAPGWSVGAIGATDRRWVSACILARSSALGVSTPKSLGGATDELAREEGGFWGDVFAGDGLSEHACSGPDVIAVPDSCAASSGRCGFTYEGRCADGVAGDQAIVTFVH